MWSRSTIAPSLLQTSCCFTRAWSSSCSMLKEMAAFDSLAEKRSTGIETSPKEMVAVAVGLGDMVTGFYASGRDRFSTRSLEGSNRNDGHRNRASRQDFLGRASEETG